LKYILWFPLIISDKSTTATKGNTDTMMNQIVTQIEIPVLLDNFGHYGCYGQYSWQKSLTEFFFFSCGVYYYCIVLL